MNAIEIVKAFNKKNNWSDENDSVFETLNEFKVFSEVIDKRRWYNSTFNVSMIEGNLICYNWAENTGDDSLSDIGWEPDISSIRFCESYPVTVTRYRPIIDPAPEAST